MTSMKLNHLVLSNEVNRFTNQSVEALTTKLFIEMVLKSMRSQMEVPDLNFDADGNIVNNTFWRDLNSNLSHLNFSFEKKKEDREEFRKSILVIESLICKTTRNDSNDFQCWHQISQFLNTLPTQCISSFASLFAPSASVKLLNRLINVTAFSTNEQIMQCMSSCLKCLSRLSEFPIPAPLPKNKLGYTLSKGIYVIDEFFEIIRKDFIFFTNAILAEDTFNIFEKGCTYPDEPTLMKKYAVIRAVFSSNNIEAQRALYEHYTTPRVMAKMICFLGCDNEYPHKAEGMELLKELLRFSQKYKLVFVFSDWRGVFANLYRPEKWISMAAKDLFLLRLDVEGYTENGNTLLIRAIEAYISKHNTNVTDIIDIFQEHEDFESCQKLFEILRNHINNRGMARMVISVIKSAADRLARCETKHDELMKLTKNVLQHVEFVKPFPDLLCKLTRIIDFVKFKNVAEVNEHFLSVENSVLNAFYECDKYSTAVGLLETLKKIGIDDVKTAEISENLLLKQTAAISRQLSLLFLALDDTFDTFNRLHPADKLVNYKWFKDIFHVSADPESRALNLALIVNILAGASSSLDIPDMSQRMIERDAVFFDEYFNSNLVMDPPCSTFIKVIASTAYCVLHAKFTLPINELSMNSVSRALATSYKSTNLIVHEFDVDLREGDNNDLRLIGKFWSKFTELYESNNQMIIAPFCFNYYEQLYKSKAHVYIVSCIEDFFLVSLQYRNEFERYAFFAKNVCDCVNEVKPISCVKLIVKAVFSFIQRSEFARDVNVIAFKTFMIIYERLRQNDVRSKTINGVQGYLFHSYLSHEDRNICLRMINDEITDSNGKEKERLRALLNHIQKPTTAHDVVVIPPPTIRNVTRKRPSSNIYQSTDSFSRSRSLPSVNLSLFE